VSVGLAPNIEQADLVAYGIFGLIDAIEKYDIDSIPRSVRFKAREVETAYVALENRLHRSPTDAEVAQQLGITTDELHQIFNQISFVSVVALDELLSVGSERGDRLSLVDTLEGSSSGPRCRTPADGGAWATAAARVVVHILGQAGLPAPVAR
jgi:RNA polymerase sigma factor FliA